MPTRLTTLLTVILTLLGSGAAMADEWLPLGDGHISKQARAGYLFACPSTLAVADNTASSPWIVGDKWNKSAKVPVRGDVAWPDASFSVSVTGDRRTLTGNGLPLHHTGIYPIQPDDPAYKYDRNPDKIVATPLSVTNPANPVLAASPSCVPFGPIGYALTGVGIYNSLDVFLRDAPAHELQDLCAGHPDPLGRYHYHSWSPCIPDPDGKAGKPSGLVGYALDGFGIYGPIGENGKPLTNADLDECHGRVSEIRWDGKMVRMYHYHFTAEFPYSIGCFRGVPVRVANDGGPPTPAK